MLAVGGVSEPRMLRGIAGRRLAHRSQGWTCRSIRGLRCSVSRELEHISIDALLLRNRQFVLLALQANDLSGADEKEVC